MYIYILTCIYIHICIYLYNFHCRRHEECGHRNKIHRSVCLAHCSPRTNTRTHAHTHIRTQPCTHTHTHATTHTRTHETHTSVRENELARERARERVRERGKERERERESERAKERVGKRGHEKAKRSARECERACAQIFKKKGEPRKEGRGKPIILRSCAIKIFVTPNIQAVVESYDVGTSAATQSGMPAPPRNPMLDLHVCVVSTYMHVYCYPVWDARSST